ncbi:MAG: DUF4377 domain-containing protein [Candidatus Thiodiazotropha taylori]|nr:DUF4377 domain-containing protein [Candidatus Thiodiazotropha taylori]
MRKLLCVLYCLLVLSGCGLSDNDSTVDEYDMTIYIDHFKEQCSLIPINGLCLRNRNSEESEWDSGIHYIEYFDYEWGYRYTLFVHVEEDTRDVDGMITEYKLLEVIEKRRAEPATLFDLVVPLHGYINKLEDQVYSLSDEKEIVCSPEHCIVLDELISQQMHMLLEFTHQEDGEPLLLTQIKCSAPRDSFLADCL